MKLYFSWYDRPNIKCEACCHQTPPVMTSDANTTVIRHHNYKIQYKDCCHQTPQLQNSIQRLLSSDTTTTKFNTKAAVIRHHNYKIQYKDCCHHTPQLQNSIQRLLSSDTTVVISNCTNKNVSLVSGIRYDILIFPASACMTKDEWNHIWSASTQTVGSKENWKK